MPPSLKLLLTWVTALFVPNPSFARLHKILYYTPDGAEHELLIVGTDFSVLAQRATLEQAGLALRPPPAAPVSFAGILGSKP